MKIYVVNKELSSAHGTTAVVLQFQGVMVYMRPIEMNTILHAYESILYNVHYAFSLVASCVLLKYARKDDVN